MAETEPTEADDGDGAGDDQAGDDPPGTDALALTVDGTEVTVALPADADADEAAAIATAIGAHLHDRARAAAAAAEDDTPDRVDEWKLAGRLKAVGRRRWPSDVREGEEWKAAARSFY